MSDAEVKDPIVSDPEAKEPKITTVWGDRKSIDDIEAAPSWAANARRYEWSDDFGDVGPEDPELEKMLFQADDKMEVGEHLQKLTDIAVTLESEASINPIISFDDAGLHPVVRNNVELCGFKIPTPIQAYCLPAVLKNLDVIGIAQTGKSYSINHIDSMLTISQAQERLPHISSPPYRSSWAKRRSFVVHAPMSPRRTLTSELKVCELSR